MRSRCCGDGGEAPDAVANARAVSSIEKRRGHRFVDNLRLNLKVPFVDQWRRRRRLVVPAPPLKLNAAEPSFPRPYRCNPEPEPPPAMSQAAVDVRVVLSDARDNVHMSH
jgi:hypothetical protein